MCTATSIINNDAAEEHETVMILPSYVLALHLSADIPRNVWYIVQQLVLSLSEEKHLQYSYILLDLRLES